MRLRRYDDGVKVVRLVNARVALAACVIAVAAVVIAVIAVEVNYQRYHQIVSTRTDSRLAQCLQDNAKTDQINHILEVTFAAGAARRTAAQESQAETFLKQLEIPRRDCSPAGIAAYYSKGVKR